MKKFVFVIVFMCFSMSSDLADDGKDTHKYNIVDEANYALLVDRMQNALVQSLNYDNVVDAQYQAYSLWGNMDLLKIKSEVIRNMKQENVKMGENLEGKRLDRVAEPFFAGINRSFENMKSVDLIDAGIFIFMFSPDFYQLRGDEYNKDMSYNAAGIAISRFDNFYWYKKIKECYQAENNNPEQYPMEVILRCMDGYKKAVKGEVAKIWEELVPYKTYFENPQENDRPKTSTPESAKTNNVAVKNK